VIRLVLIALIYSASVLSQDNWATIEKDKKIQLATEGAFAPFNFFRGKTLTGFEVELAEALASELGLSYDWKTFPFDGLLIGLNMNRFHLVAASHGITEERAKSVDFTNPHYCTGGVILSRDGSIQKASDLAGKVIGVQVGTTYYQKAQALSGIKEIKTFPKDTDALTALMGKKIDAMITDRFVAMEIADKQKGLKLGELVFEEKIAMAIKKNQPKLLEEVNKALKSLKTKGKYKEISLKYFNEDISCHD
jgi:polar amino acid transport system substrate-binding protein